MHIVVNIVLDLHLRSSQAVPVNFWVEAPLLGLNYLVMNLEAVFYEQIVSIEALIAAFYLAFVKFCFGVSSMVVLLIAPGGESLIAV